MASIEMTLGPVRSRSVPVSYPPPGEPLLKAMARAVLTVHTRQSDDTCAGCAPLLTVRYPCYGARLAEQILAG